MSFKLHLILARKPSVFIRIRCNFPDISYLSETQKNNFLFLNESLYDFIYINSKCYNIHAIYVGKA